MKQIILEDPEVRLNILGYVFGIDKYKRTRENLSILLNRLKEDSKILQMEIKYLDEERAKLDSTKNLLLDLQTRIDKQQIGLNEKVNRRKIIEKELKELESRIKEKETFEKEVEKAKIMIGSKRDTIIMLDKEFSNLQRNLSEQGESFSEDKLLSLAKSISEKKEEIEQHHSKYIDFSSRINGLEKNKQAVSEKKNEVFKIEMCPTCLQNVPYAHKHNILNEMEKSLNDIINNISQFVAEKNESKALLDKSRMDLPRMEEEKIRLEILKSRIVFIEKSRKRAEEITKIK